MPLPFLTAERAFAATDDVPLPFEDRERWRRPYRPGPWRVATAALALLLASYVLFAAVVIALTGSVSDAAVIFGLSVLVIIAALRLLPEPRFLTVNISPDMLVSEPVQRVLRKAGRLTGQRGTRDWAGCSTSARPASRSIASSSPGSAPTRPRPGPSSCSARSPAGSTRTRRWSARPSRCG